MLCGFNCALQRSLVLITRPASRIDDPTLGIEAVPIHQPPRNPGAR